MKEKSISNQKKYEPIKMNLRSGKVYQQPISSVMEFSFTVDDKVFKNNDKNNLFLVLQILEGNRMLIIPLESTTERNNQIVCQSEVKLL
jgi:hypothetical protein